MSKYILYLNNIYILIYLLIIKMEIGDKVKVLFTGIAASVLLSGCVHMKPYTLSRDHLLETNFDRKEYCYTNNIQQVVLDDGTAVICYGFKF